MKTAISAERLLWWVYGEQLAHLDGSLDFGEDEPSAMSPTAAVCRILELQAFIDAGTPGVLRIDADAEAVHAVVRLSPARVLLVNQARLRGRPDWKPGAAPRVVGDFMMTHKGAAPKVMYRNGRPDHCMVKEVDSWASIGAARRKYRDWVVALAWVQAVLRGVSLRRFCITEERPAFFPWDEAPVERRILSMEAVA